MRAYHNNLIGFYARNACIGAFLSLSSHSIEAAEPRMMWGAIADDSHGWLTNVPGLMTNKDKLLLSWRMLPGDTPQTAFDVYVVHNGKWIKVNSEPISDSTCYQVPSEFVNKTADSVFYLCHAGERKVIASYILPLSQYVNRLPYVSIMMEETASDNRINDAGEYLINDGAVGDIDGDGEYEIVLARCAYGFPENTVPRSPAIVEAYKLDGTHLWRVVWGNNISASNSIAMIVADLDGDGKDEVTIRSSEGTVFGDGKSIGDTNGDGRIDYAEYGKHNSLAPEFVSVLDGSTGAELARAPYIPILTSEHWGDSYFKRANSLRLAAATLLPGGKFQIVATRGIYERMELEAWEYIPGNQELRHIWKFTTDDYPDYIGQGNHQLAVADVDGDGLDEITYGACAIDHDGSGLYSTGLGHGDMLHVGKFLKDRDGLQCFQCFETGKTRCALRDAATGEILWKLEAEEECDEGRCLIADIDPDNPGYEAWCYDRQMHDKDGNPLGYTAPQVNFPIWWTGSLNRQLFDRMVIECFSRSESDKTRVFNMHRYGVACGNSSKSNACFIGDFLGDWREEIIIARQHPTAMENNRPLPGSKELLIFSTWHPTGHKFPYLLSDPVYYRGAIHQHVGYNTPLHFGYYFSSDDTSAGIDDFGCDSDTSDFVINNSTIVFKKTPDFVRLAGIDGRVVMQDMQPTSLTMYVSSLRKGIYILQYKCDKAHKAFKIML